MLYMCIVCTCIHAIVNFDFVAVLANSSSTLQQTQSTPILLEVESVVEFGDPVQYGTIKRIEEDSILYKEVALIETVT